MKPYVNDSHQTRIALLEQSVININEILQRVDKRFDIIEAKMDSNFKWMIGTILIGIIIPIALKLLHWG